MSSINQKLVTVAMTASTILSVGLMSDNPAQAVTFRLDWTGQTEGYTADGTFSYDETQIPSNGIVREDNLETFEIAFFTPEGNLIEEFVDDHLSPGVNFNFDTTSGEILQSGLWDAPDGISLGAPREEGLNFWSVPGALFDGDSELPPSPNPHVHLTDWLEEYPNLPRGFRFHLDVAFFTVSTDELLDDPTAGNEVGQRLTATKVPEPASGLGIGLIGTAILLMNRRRATVPRHKQQ